MSAAVVIGALILKAPITTAADDIFFFFFFFYFSELLSIQFTWNVRTCFLWKLKKENLECRLLQILLGALRVKD